MSVTERERLAPEVFRLPVEKIREGYYSDVYFNYAKATLELEDRHPRALMQVFQRKDSILGGVDEALAVLRQCAGRRRLDGSWEDGWDSLEVHALHEGDEIEPWETVMTIEGDYSVFAHLETVYLGCMARRTLVMRNVREVVDAAGGKPIIYFPARHDHWLVQTGDGWAAHVAGAIGVSTDAQASWWGGRGIGTVPHGLIAAYGGDTVAAARAFSKGFGGQMQVTVLVDFENDSVRTALEVAEALGPSLWGVRLDTSESLADLSLQAKHGDAAPRGVDAELVQLVRDELDGHGFRDVKIVVSGGFNAERIRALRGCPRARRRVRRRLGADPRLQRLHGRRRGGRRAAVREGRARVPAQPAPHSRSLTSGTKRTRSCCSRRSVPPASRCSSTRRWSSPTGPTRRPPSASCSGSAGGITRIAAATLIAS